MLRKAIHSLNNSLLYNNKLKINGINLFYANYTNYKISHKFSSNSQKIR